MRTEEDFQKQKSKQRLAKSQAFQSGGAGAVNTALFIQNTVQLRQLMLMECTDENDVAQVYKDCFASNHEVLYVLIILSLAFQVVYSVFIITGI